MQSRFDDMMAQMRLQTATEIEEIREQTEEAKALASTAASSASAAHEAIRGLRAEMEKLAVGQTKRQTTSQNESEFADT
eukprot:10458777-Karenia_brevis.AAC.1